MVYEFSPDGEAIYGTTETVGGKRAGLAKIDFNPTRASIIPGSMGLGTIWNITLSEPAGKYVVIGIYRTPDAQSCTFELDPASGTVRPLPVGSRVNCREGGGPISPDGKRIVSHAGKRLSIVNLENDSTQAIRGTDAGELTGGRWLSGVKWSPDGRSLSVVRDGHLSVINANDTTERRNLGRVGNSQVWWSPDSRSLLIVKSQLRCAASLFFQSFETIDVQAGKRRIVKDSVCNISGGSIGWLRCDIANR